MELQGKVEEFVDENDLEATPAFRLIDVFAEMGEIASDAAKSSDYGMSEGMDVPEDEIGDALFSLLSFASDLDVDVEKALENSIEKYRKRIERKGDPGSS